MKVFVQYKMINYYLSCSKVTKRGCLVVLGAVFQDMLGRLWILKCLRTGQHEYCGFLYGYILQEVMTMKINILKSDSAWW